MTPDERFMAFVRTRDPWKVAIALLSFWYVGQTIRNPEGWLLLDNVNLVIHEAGHTIFSFFGEFIQIAAGSGFQVLVPVVFVVYFLMRREWFSAALVLMWSGESAINVSVYAADAASMKLPLLADGLTHDWHYLLDRTGLLSYTDIIGRIIYVDGVMTIIIAFILAMITAQRRDSAYVPFSKSDTPRSLDSQGRNMVQ